MIEKDLYCRYLSLNIHFVIYDQSTCIQLSEEIIDKLRSEKSLEQNYKTIKLNSLAFVIFSINGDNRIPREVELWLRNNKSYCNIYTCLLGDFDKKKNDLGEEIIQEIITTLNQLAIDLNFGYLSIDTPIIDFVGLTKQISFNLFNMKLQKLSSFSNYLCSSNSTIHQQFNHPIFENEYWNKICKLLGKIPYVERLSDCKNSDVSIEFSDKKPYPRSIILNCNRDILNQIWTCLDKIPYIKALKFPYAEIQEWPDINLHNLNLRLLKLDIRGNNFKNFSFLKKFKNIENINISANNLKELPGEIYELKNLVIINAYKNSIATIGGNISKLSKLKRLSLYRNLIEFVPDEIAKCSNLEYLNLGANPIRYLPEAIKFMQNLKELSLRNCKLHEIPKFLYNMDWLNLNLEKNFLSDV